MAHVPSLASKTEPEVAGGIGKEKHSLSEMAPHGAACQHRGKIDPETENSLDNSSMNLLDQPCLKPLNPWIFSYISNKFLIFVCQKELCEFQ